MKKKSPTPKNAALSSPQRSDVTVLRSQIAALSFHLGQARQILHALAESVTGRDTGSVSLTTNGETAALDKSGGVEFQDILEILPIAAAEENLQRLVESRKLPQRELAKIIGTSPSTVCRILKNPRNAKFGVLKELARALVDSDDKDARLLRRAAIG
jgi:predicted DNA-binding protein (UPF0251 family)